MAWKNSFFGFLDAFQPLGYWTQCGAPRIYQLKRLRFCLGPSYKRGVFAAWVFLTYARPLIQERLGARDLLHDWNLVEKNDLSISGTNADKASYFYSRQFIGLRFRCHLVDPKRKRCPTHSTINSVGVVYNSYSALLLLVFNDWIRCLRAPYSR